MEISRWSFDKISSISDRYRNFRDFLAEVLEGERPLVQPSAAALAAPLKFEIRDDIEKVEHFEKVRANDRKGLIQAFKALAPYFEAGFLIQSQTSASASGAVTTHALESMFLLGKVFAPPAAEAPVVEMNLPNFASTSARGKIFRGRVASVLKVFRLDRLTGLNEASAFAFAPDASGATFVLICNRPQLWQVSALEAAARLVIESLTPAPTGVNASPASAKSRRST